MVRVEPFIYQKITAFKERVQMVNKINEIVESLNGVFDENQVKEYVANELLNYYTKEEVDTAIADIDFSPYATKVYVDDAIDSIDLTPYATNERVNEEVETLDNKIDTKQNILNVGNGLDLNNDNLSLKDFVIYPSNNWSNLITLQYGDLTVSNDLIIEIFNSNIGIQEFIYMPKGSYKGISQKFITKTSGVYGTNTKYLDTYGISFLLSLSGNNITATRLRCEIDLDTNTTTYNYTESVTFAKSYNGDGCKIFYRP